VRRAEPVEQFVSELMLRRLQRDDVRELLAAAAEDGRAAELVAEAERIRTEMDALMRERVQGRITPRQFSVGNEELAARLAAVEARMVSASVASSVSLREFVDGGVTRERWDALDVDRRRTFIAKAMEVRLRPVGRGVRNPAPETVEVRWRRDL